MPPNRGIPDANTKLLITSDYGAGTTFLDRATRKVITNNNVTKSSTQKRFGNTSAYFNGTSAYLTTTANSDFNLGNGAFTIDCWIYVTDLSKYEILCSQYAYNTSGAWFITFAVNSIFGLYWTTDGTQATAAEVDVSWVKSVNTWYHIAVTRSGNNVRFFVNGIQQGTTQTVTATFFTSTANFEIGHFLYAGTNYYFPGYIDEFRISKGIARWTSNFTPPTRRYGHNSI